jgi:hypothetical protein
MAVRLSPLRAGRPLPPGGFLELISVRGWVDPRAILGLEGLGQLKNPMTSSGIEPVTFRLVSSKQLVMIKGLKSNESNRDRNMYCDWYNKLVDLFPLDFNHFIVQWLNTNCCDVKKKLQCHMHNIKIKFVFRFFSRTYFPNILCFDKYSRSYVRDIHRNPCKVFMRESVIIHQKSNVLTYFWKYPPFVISY